MKTLLLRLHGTLLAARVLLFLSSCTTPANEEIPTDPGKPQKGVVSGRVLDTNGKPLANANIVVNNAQF